MSATRQTLNAYNSAAKALLEAEWQRERRLERRRAWRAHVRSERIQALAEEDWNALPNQPDPRKHAQQHLAEMTPERRAQLEAEWLGVMINEGDAP